MSSVPSAASTLSSLRTLVHHRQYSQAAALAARMLASALPPATHAEVIAVLQGIPLRYQPAFCDDVPDGLAQSIDHIWVTFGVDILSYSPSMYLTFARDVIYNRRQPQRHLQPSAALFRIVQYPPFGELTYYDLLVEAIWGCLELLTSPSDAPEVHLWITQSLELARQSIAVLHETNDPRFIGDIDRILRFIVNHDLKQYQLHTEILQIVSRMINSYNLSVVGRLTTAVATAWGNMVNPGDGAAWLPLAFMDPKQR